MANPPRRGLLDQFGETIPPEQIAALREEISPVGGIYARPPFQGHLAYGINPQRLGAVIRAADSGSTLDWWILAEEIEELYPHYATVLAKRKRQVVQLPITVKAADDKDPESVKDADLIRAWLDTGVLQHALFDVTDAIGKGFSVSEIIWDQVPGRTWPVHIKYRPQRFFEFSYLDMETIWLRSENGFEDLPPHKFLVHRHPSKSGNLSRAGLTRVVAFLWCYATFTLKDWALFTQAYGLPVRLGKYGPGASDADKRTLWRAVSSIAGDVAAIIPDSMQMEFVTQADRAAGAQLYEKRLDWLDRTVSRVVLGGDASTSAVAGSHAVGKTHREGEDDVEKFDAFLLNGSINRQLIAPIVAFTNGPRKAYPLVTIGRPTEIPIKDVVEALADLGTMGLKAKMSQILERLQLDPPVEGDEVVGGVPAPAPVEKPVIPTPAKVLPADGFTQRGFLGGLIARHAEASPEVLDALNARLAEDAAGALHGLTGTVRHAFESASDMRDLAHRLHALKLNSDDFAEAMARGMALANLAGQAELADELHIRTSRHAVLTPAQRAAAPAGDWAVPGKKELYIGDREHTVLAWDMVDRTEDLTPAERTAARRRILARAARFGIDTSKWRLPRG